MKKNLAEYTDAELIAELQKRKDSAEEESDEKHYLFVGIIDFLGAESLVLADTPEKLEKLLSSLRLRARYNSQRNPEVFSVRMPMKLFTFFDKKIRGGGYAEAGEALKSLSTFRKLGF